MNQDYKISVIIPAYNVEKYIEQCLRSIMNQTYKNLEIIVVNDGSKDGTGEIIKRLAKEDDRIVFIDQENQGVSASRNNALARVDSDFVMFVDSDDWLDLDTCEYLIEEIKKENADVVLFGYVREYKEKSMPKAMFDEERIVFEGQDVKDKIHRRVFGPIGEELANPGKLNALTSTCMEIIKTDIIKNLRFVPMKELGLCEDGYFNISVLKNAQKVVFVKKYFYHYRKIIDGASLSQKKNDNTYEDAKKFNGHLLKLIEDENLSNDYKNATSNRLALCLVERVNNKNIVYKNIKKILHDEKYIEAINQLEFKYFPIHWKLFFKCAKMKFTFGVYALLKMINLILAVR